MSYGNFTTQFKSMDYVVLPMEQSGFNQR